MAATMAASMATTMKASAVKASAVESTSMKPMSKVSRMSTKAPMR